MTAPAAPPDDLVAQIHAFLADAPKGQLHTGYRYGELLEQAADRIAELELRRDVISDVQNKQLRHAEADNAKLREALRELVECKDLGIAATRKLHEDAGSIQHGRIMNEEAKQMDAEYSRRIGPAWHAARAALEQP